MGSSLGSFLADIFMRNLEQNQLLHQTNGYWYYIENIFHISQGPTDMAMMLAEFNGVRINLTLEQESKEVFVFLEVLRKRRIVSLVQLSVYVRPIWMGQYTLRCKQNLVLCLAMRA